MWWRYWETASCQTGSRLCLLFLQSLSKAKNPESLQYFFIGLHCRGDYSSPCLLAMLDLLVGVLTESYDLPALMLARHLWTAIFTPTSHPYGFFSVLFFFFLTYKWVHIFLSGVNQDKYIKLETDLLWYRYIVNFMFVNWLNVNFIYNVKKWFTVVILTWK